MPAGETGENGASVGEPERGAGGIGGWYWGCGLVW